MRNTMISRFYCSNCGEILSMKYPCEVEVLPNSKPGDIKSTHKNPYVPSDPTGADVFYNPILIEPCRSCIDRELEPARKIAEGISAIAENTGIFKDKS